MDPASNAYSHAAEMPIVCLTPPMDFLRRIQLKPAFTIVALRNLSSSASLITLSSFFYSEQMTEIFLVAIEGKFILFINTIQVIESKQIVSCLFTLEIIVYWQVVIICEITRDV